MPPHNDLTDPLYGTYTTTTTTVPYTNIVTDRITVNPDGITLNQNWIDHAHAFTLTDERLWRADTFKMPTFVTQEDLDKLMRKFYRIMSEHVIVDISEDEFMKLLNEQQDE